MEPRRQGEARPPVNTPCFEKGGGRCFPGAGRKGHVWRPSHHSEDCPGGLISGRRKKGACVTAVASFRRRSGGGQGEVYRHVGNECPLHRGRHLRQTICTFRKRVWYFHLATRQLGMNGCCNRTGVPRRGLSVPVTKHMGCAVLPTPRYQEVICPSCRDAYFKP
jgi:hypothetical protein